jgi:polyisoprenoid-binding protein YceI/peroxiredoxin
MSRRIIVFVAAMALVSTLATAETKTFEIDPVHSTVTFSIRHLYSTFTGRFNTFSGTLSGDFDNPDSWHVSAVVETASIDTANADRDKHLTAADFFDSKRLPMATFESTKSVSAGKRKGAVTGRFTLHGVTRDVTFAVDFLGYGPDHRKGKRAGIQAKATINRTDFGMGYNAKLPNGLSVLSEDVEIILNLEAIEVENAVAEAAPTLAEQIATFRERSSKKGRSPEIAKALEKASAEIAAQGGIDGLKPGDTAPDFLLPDANGKPVSLYQQLKKGPVVLAFYRGAWCPFCNIQLKALEEAYPEMLALNATLIGIAPQNTNKSKIQVEKSAVSFPLLSDITGDTLRDYRLLYKVPAEMRKIYLENFKIDLDEYNGEGRWELPVTATFVIGSDRKVAAGLVDLDYTKRMEPSDIVKALRELGGK